MNQQIFNFLREFSTNEETVNKLLVTAFVVNNKLKLDNNIHLRRMIIPSDSTEFINVDKFLLTFCKTTNTPTFSFENLVELFEFVISPSDKVINGAVYTSSRIRKYITREAFKSLKDKKDFAIIKIADISCGCGGFLLDASKYLHEKTGVTFKKIYKENIFGIDIQEYSIERTKILLSLYAVAHGEDEREFEFNLYVGNSLIFDWKLENKTIYSNGGFDMILGNPPYVCSRNMDDNTKKSLHNWSVCKSGHPDLYIPFFQIGYELLAPDGILGFITVNNFIRSLNGRALRMYFSEKQVPLRIIDFEGEQIFNARTTYTCIAFLSKTISSCVLYTASQSQHLTKNLPFKTYFYNDLNNFSGWSLKDSDFVFMCESIGNAFSELYNTRCGIATLRNDVYIFRPKKEDNDFYYFSDNIPIEKSICKDIVNSNSFVRNSNFEAIKEKIIFPYIYDNDENNTYPKPIDENSFKDCYPNAYAHLFRHKNELALRDKGKGANYPIWYAFGRTQSLEKVKYKLLFPHLARENFFSYLSDDKDLYFYNGMAAYSDSIIDLVFLQQILRSEFFWSYVKNVSKNYNSNYYSLGKNYIKKFGVPVLNKNELNKFLSLKDKREVNIFLNKYYKLPHQYTGE